MALGLFYGSKPISSGSSNLKIEEWQPTTIYNSGDYVYTNNNLYQAIKDHTSTSDFDDDLTNGNWKLIVGSLSNKYIELDTNSDGSTYVMAGSKVISGTKKTTETDPVTGAITEIEQTPNYTLKTVTTTTTDPTTSETTKTIEILKGNSDGVEISSASGTKQTIITDSTGSEILNETENVLYENGVQVEFMTEDDVKSYVDQKAQDLGWE